MDFHSPFLGRSDSYTSLSFFPIQNHIFKIYLIQIVMTCDEDFLLMSLIICSFTKNNWSLIFLGIAYLILVYLGFSSFLLYYLGFSYFLLYNLGSSYFLFYLNFLLQMICTNLNFFCNNFKKVLRMSFLLCWLFCTLFKTICPYFKFLKYLIPLKISISVCLVKDLLTTWLPGQRNISMEPKALPH